MLCISYSERFLITCGNVTETLKITRLKNKTSKCYILKKTVIHDIESLLLCTIACLQRFTCSVYSTVQSSTDFLWIFLISNNLMLYHTNEFPEADSSLAQLYTAGGAPRAWLQLMSSPCRENRHRLPAYDQQTSPVGGLQWHCQPWHGRPRDCRQWVTRTVPCTHDHRTCCGRWRAWSMFTVFHGVPPHPKYCKVVHFIELGICQIDNIWNPSF